MNQRVKNYAAYASLQLIMDKMHLTAPEVMALTDEQVATYLSELGATKPATKPATALATKKPSLPVIANCLNNCIEKHQEKELQEARAVMQPVARTPTLERLTVCAVAALRADNMNRVGAYITIVFQDDTVEDFKYLLDALLAAKQAAHGKE